MRLRFGRAGLIALLFAARAGAQDAGGRITGTVTDAEGQAPMPNAIVTVIGTRLSALTRADGKYTLTHVPAGSHKVRATRLGYAPKEQDVSVSAGSDVTADFSMVITAIPLEAAVVVGYGSVRRGDLTGSVASIIPDASSVPTQSLEQVLVGKVPGVIVTQASSEPGGGISIRIRGGSSINGNNEPLYVVDGFPIENDLAGSSPGAGGRDSARTVPFNPLNSINPGDIESVDILKDASATAIYGARGANGVIIITTRRGSGSKPKITLDSYTGTSTVAHQYDLLSGSEFMQFVNTWAAAQSPVVPQPYTQAQIDSIGKGTDWQKLIFRDGAPMRSLQLGVTGGTASANATKYSLSGSLFDQEGVVQGSSLRRVSVRGGLDQTIGSRFRATSNLVLSQVKTTAIPTAGGSNQSAGAIGAALQYYPTIPVRKADGTYTLLVNDGPVALAPSNVPNPVSLVHDVIDRLGDNRAMVNLAGDLTLPMGFGFRMTGGADYLARWRDTYYPRTTLQGFPVDGQANRGRNESMTLLNENTLNYQHSFGSLGTINAVGGYSRQKQTASTTSMLNSNYVSDLTTFQDFGAGARVNGPSISTTRADWTFVSYFGRLNYTFRDRYIFTATSRRDGSSRFGSGKKWGVFPSAAFAWLVTEEPFASKLPVVSSAKVRVSWGLAGNPSIRPYQSLTRLSAERYAFNGTAVTGYFPGVLGNNDLTWESTEERNYGLDLGVMHDKLELTMDIYNKHTHDLLLAQQLPLDAGFGTVLVNRGSVSNEGVELGLTAHILNGDGMKSGVRWTSTVNYASNKNKVLNLGGDTLVFAAQASADIGINGSVIKVGQPLGVFYGYEIGGIIRSAQDSIDVNAKSKPGTGAWRQGDAWIVQHDTSLITSPGDRTVIGSPLPKFTLGWTNTLSWQRFDVSTTLDGSYGAKLYNLNVNRLESGSPRTNLTRDRWLDAWTPTNTNAKYPRIGGSLLNIGTDMTSDMLQDGSYTRLRNVTVGYTLAQRFASRMSVSSVRVFVTGSNLKTWTDYQGYNPDVSSISVGNVNRGIDIGAYPLARTWTFGVNLSY